MEEKKEGKKDRNMATASPPAKSPPLAHPLSPLAGVLSYLVPGLGQITQGRIGKGLLFLVCIYTLFFYGMYLGSGSVTIGERTYRLSSNVYLPDTAEEKDKESSLPTVVINLYNRPQFAGQFWVGIAAWPAIWQYMHYNKKVDHELNHEIDELYAQAEAEKGDPEAAEQKRRQAQELENSERRRHPILGDFQREPSASCINAVHNAGDKRLELGWVYTVIAGVLNIMVIYDAVAGPAFLASRRKDEEETAS
jgi:hypothetical protein